MAKKNIAADFRVSSYIIHAVFAVVIFYAVIAQGAYFTAPLVILNVFFLLSLAFSKKPIAPDLNLAILTGVFVIMAVAAFFAHSANAAIVELLKYALFPLSYTYFCRLDETGKTRVGKVFYAAFVLVMVFGLLGMAGLSPVDGMVTVIGGRLQSFFQYANTTALVMGIGVFYSTERVVNCRGDRPRSPGYNVMWKKAIEGDRPYMVFYSLMAVLFFTAMVFTLSRVSFVLFVPLYLLYVFRFVSLKIKAAALGSVAALAVLLVAVDSRLMRISIFAPTLVERYISYFDALGMMLRRPLGVGLGNWQFLQFYHQSAPYQVRFIHNFYLHVGLDGGFVAMFAVVALVCYALVKAEKGVHFYIGVFLLTGAFFEVYFNFGVIIIYFGFLLTRIVPRDAQLHVAPRVLRYARYLALLPVIPLAILFISNYHVNTGEAHERAGNRAAAYQSFLTAHRLNPLNESLYLSRARTVPTMQHALDYLYRAHRANPWETQVLFSLAQGQARMGNMDSAYAHACRLLTIFPFSTANQELMREIILQFDDAPTRQRLLQELDARIEEINGGINPLFRHIDPYFRY